MRSRLLSKGGLPRVLNFNPCPARLSSSLDLLAGICTNTLRPRSRQSGSQRWYAPVVRRLPLGLINNQGGGQFKRHFGGQFKGRLTNRKNTRSRLLSENVFLYALGLAQRYERPSDHKDRHRRVFPTHLSLEQKTPAKLARKFDKSPLATGFVYGWPSLFLRTHYSLANHRFDSHRYNHYEIFRTQKVRSCLLKKTLSNSALL